MHTPLSKFKLKQTTDNFIADASQEQAVQKLQHLFDDLISPNKPSLLTRLRPSKSIKPRTKGLYIWGGVGRGKTYLMDLFYTCLPFKEKTRTHFHAFMVDIHQQLAQFRGHKNPLNKIADNLAKTTRVICFDEFFVNDIADAMILAQLFNALFAHNVVLVATSNIEPDQLYMDGLQRSRFLPAIDLIKQHTDIMHLDDGTDYRMRHLTQAERYYYPLDDNSHLAMQSFFQRLTGQSTHPTLNANGHAIDADSKKKLIINHRTFECIDQSDKVIWFTYEQLCKLPRSANDYLYLAKQYDTLFISGILCLTSAEDDQARRFINLIDVLYDHHTKLVISAAGPIPQLYSGTRLAFAFERTQSRLQEMQTQDYLGTS